MDEQPSSSLNVLEAAAVAAPMDVLIATSDHAGHGMFAIVERVINQILLARRIGAIPYVYIGPAVFAPPNCSLRSQPYYDPRLGDNVWDYYFVQPSGYRLGDSTAGGRPVRSVQVVSPETLYQQDVLPSGGSAFTQAYGSTVYYDEERMRAFRAAASSVVANGSLVLPRLARRADRHFSRWRQASKHILGMHLRGTDKVVNRKVAPEAYFPFADAWITAHPDALLMVATDEAAYFQRIVARYGRWGSGGRVVSLQEGFAVDNVITSRELSGRVKGESAVLDALLLSKADFLLKTTSALAEFALWVSPRLHRSHADLQFSDRFQSQQLPSWAEPVVRDGARAFCEGLAHGCAMDGASGALARSDDNPEGAILRPGQACVLCQPLAQYPVRARRITRGSCEDAAAGLRSMTEAECVGFVKGLRRKPEAGGRRRSFTYIGAVVEPSEPSGCLLWGRAKVEFNSHAGGAPRSCDLSAKHGACICVETGREWQAGEKSNAVVVGGGRR